MQKKLLFIIGMFFTVSVFGQTDKAQNSNVIKVNPLGLIFGNASVSFERVINPKSAFQVNLLFGSRTFYSTQKYVNFGAGVDYRFYLSKNQEAPRGVYVSPGLGFNSTKVTSGGDTFKGSGLIAKGVLGNQWVFKNQFVIDLFAGASYYFNGDLGANGVSYSKFSGTIPVLGVGIGYNF